MLLKTIGMLVTAAAAFLLLIGCGSEQSTPDSQKPVARSIPKTPRKPGQRNTIVEKIDEDGKGMHLTATNPAGKEFRASIGDEVELPEEFPRDVPIFPGSTPMASMFAPDEGVIVTFRSTEKQQDIFDFYQSSLSDDGWEILDEPLLDQPLSFEAIKEDRKISVTVAGRKGDSRVSVIVTAVN